MEAASQFVSVVLINLLLSGDNAIVIGMAAAPLQPTQRRAAIVIGGGLAIVLRVILTWLAVELLQVPAVAAVGGLLLLWIAFNLLKQEEESAEGVKEAASLGGAITTIAVADLIMSLDNVLGVAAAAHGSIGFLIFGLALSMAIVIAGGGVLAAIIARFTWLAYVGSAVIAWTGAQIALSDGLVSPLIGDGEQLRDLISGLATAVVVVLAHYLHRHRPKQTTVRSLGG